MKKNWFIKYFISKKMCYSIHNLYTKTTKTTNKKRGINHIEAFTPIVYATDKINTKAVKIVMTSLYFISYQTSEYIYNNDKCNKNTLLETN